MCITIQCNQRGFARAVCPINPIRWIECKLNKDVKADRFSPLHGGGGDRLKRQWGKKRLLTREFIVSRDLSSLEKLRNNALCIQIRCCFSLCWLQQRSIFFVYTLLLHSVLDAAVTEQRSFAVCRGTTCLLCYWWGGVGGTRLTPAKRLKHERVKAPLHPTFKSHANSQPVVAGH